MFGRQHRDDAPLLGERARTAIHEAGHFVIAELYPCDALEVFAVSIAERGPFAGGLIADAADMVDRSGLRGLVAVLLAGFEAEWSLLGTPAFENAVTDLRQAQVLLSELARNRKAPLEDLWRGIQTRVRGLLTRHWDAVEGVAAELLRETVISSEEARAIVRSRVPTTVRYRDGRPIPPPLRAGAWPQVHGRAARRVKGQGLDPCAYDSGLFRAP